MAPQHAFQTLPFKFPKTSLPTKVEGSGSISKEELCALKYKGALARPSKYALACDKIPWDRDVLDSLPPMERLVTIAIGFKCTDGIVLATDSQITRGTSKKTGPKLFPVLSFPEHERLATVIAGAGGVGFMQRAVSTIALELKTLTDPSLEDVRATIESSLLAFYKTHMYPRPGWEEVDFSLLVGCWTEKDGFSLLKTQQTAVNPLLDKTGYSAIGSGVYVSEYALDLVFEMGLNVEHAKMLATFCIKAAKDYASYCGGDTRIHALQFSELGGGVTKNISRPEVERCEKHSTDLYDVVKSLFQLVDTDTFSDDVIVEDFTNLIRDNIIEFRTKHREGLAAQRLREAKRLERLVAASKPQSRT